MFKKELTKTSKLLLWVCAGIETLDTFLMTPQEFRRRAWRGNLFKSTNNFDSLYYYLFRQGYLKFVDKNNERFVKITKKGELAILLAKSRIHTQPKWDGKWWVIIFDIPEESRVLRNRFRQLLKTYGFKQLQASVFISPYSLSREGVLYLKESGLIAYIRILKVEEMDNDKDLRKLFGLK